MILKITLFPVFSLFDVPEIMVFLSDFGLFAVAISLLIGRRPLFFSFSEGKATFHELIHRKVYKREEVNYTALPSECM